MKEIGRHFKVALSLTFLSGCAALSHELLWTRRLIDLLGASTASTARVFGCFFFGLALGGACAARIIKRVRRPWRLVALTEAGVALLSLPILFLSDWTGWIWPALGMNRLVGWQGGTVKGLLAFLMIVPPASLMGAVLPLLARAVLTRERALQRDGVWLYGINTLGGVIGLLLTGLITLRLWGVQGAMAAAMALNLGIAAACFQVDRSKMFLDLPPEAVKDRRTGQVAYAWPALLAVAFFSGAGVLAVEVIFLQLFQLSAVLSFYATNATLVAIILLLALSSFLVGGLANRFPSPGALVSPILSLSAVTLVLAPLLFMSSRVQQVLVASNDSLGAVLFKLIAVAVVTLGPGMLFAGMVLPLIFVVSGTEAGDSCGRRLGWLLAANGAGGLVGSELAYRLALPGLGVHQGLGVVALTYGIAAVIATILFGRGKRLSWLAVGAACLVALITSKSLADLPQINAKYGLKVLSLRTGREGQVAVVENDGFGRAILLNNQYLLGSTSTTPDQERQAHLPLMLHPNPRSVGFIGIATGSTAAAALKHDSVERVEAIEISASVVAAAREYFGSVNAALFSDRRAHVSIEDGRTYLAAAPARFDVIVGDLFLPWGSGTGRLYSQEHFHGVRRALKPGGIFCQWLPMHQLTPDEFSSILATFQSVFGCAYLFRANLDASHPWLGLIGFKEADLDWKVVESRCAATRAEGKIRDPFLRHSTGIQMLYLARAVAPMRPTAPVNTLGNCWVEFNAAQERLTGNPVAKYLTGDRWLSFASSRNEHSDARSDEPALLKNASAVGWMLTYARALQARGRDVPNQVLSAVRTATTAALRDDPSADWRCYWPGLRPLITP